jgi:uncharacterized membrane protein required for colicin V production
MTLVLDLILLLIAGITILNAIKKGLVKTVIDACSLILSAVLSILVAPFFKDVFNFTGENSVVATYLIIFIVVWIVIKIVASILDKIIKSLPVIKTVNTLGGFILGVLLGIFRVSVYCIAVGGIIEIAHKLNVDFFKNVFISDTFLLKYFYEYNPIYILINLLMN